MKINLTANNIPEEAIKAYLEQNASKTLADKINNGTPHTTEDGKVLINRKTLNGFYKYATEKARKEAPKNTFGAYVDNETVFGWAIHYFEEDSIIGELFNLDGTPYKAEKKAPKTPEKAPQKPKTDTPKQMSILTENTAQTEKKAVILPTPDLKPTEDYRSLPKTTEKPKKNIDPDQFSIFDF